MTSEARETPADVQAPGWAQALNDLELSLREAGRAAAALRRGLEAIGFNIATADALLGERQSGADEASAVDGSAVARARAPHAQEAPVETERVANEPPHKDKDEVSSFDRLWEKIERERTERAEGPTEPVDDRRGLELLPQHYLMTVEDREGRVSLVPLHRGLQGLNGIEEVTLVSYANGVPVISLRTKKALDMDALGDAVGRVMDRQCEVIQQDTGRLYLRLKANAPGEGQ